MLRPVAAAKSLAKVVIATRVSLGMKYYVGHQFLVLPFGRVQCKGSNQEFDTNTAACRQTFDDPISDHIHEINAPHLIPNSMGLEDVAKRIVVQVCRLAKELLRCRAVIYPACKALNSIGDRVYFGYGLFSGSSLLISRSGALSMRSCS